MVSCGSEMLPGPYLTGQETVGPECLIIKWSKSEFPQGPLP